MRIWRKFIIKLIKLIEMDEMKVKFSVLCFFFMFIVEGNFSFFRKRGYEGFVFCLLLEMERKGRLFWGFF